MKNGIRGAHQAILESGQQGIGSLLQDLLTLAKARVLVLLIFTAAVGEVLAPNFSQHWRSALAGLLGLALAGAAGGVLNQLLEPSLDQHMRRTRRRPLAEGRISQGGAIFYAILLFVGAVAVLAWGTNPMTLGLTLLGTVGYGVVYTLYLKPATPWNIVWGGLAGALPPLIGWTAITGELAVMPLLLVLLIFVWTPAHFWPLAICYREDYAQARIPMLPVTHGVERTQQEILRYALLTWGVSLLPALLVGDWIYGMAALLAGGWYVGMTWRLRKMSVGPEMNQYARSIFTASISYLFFLFFALVAGKWVLSHGFI